MASKRMFSMKIVDSGAFLEMPLSAQCLYFHLNMRADDDGFVDNAKQIMRMINASEDDYKLLIAKRFIIAFPSQIAVVKHWWIHNTLMKDRYEPTPYTDEKSMLVQKENKAYSLMLTECYQNDNTDKIRLDKSRLDKENKAPAAYYPDEQLNNAMKDFIAHRKAIKRPMTENAIKLTKSKLDKLSNGNKEDAIAILNQSIEGGWSGIYPLHEDAKKPRPKYHNFEQRTDDLDAAMLAKIKGDLDI